MMVLNHRGMSQKCTLLVQMTFTSRNAKSMHLYAIKTRLSQANLEFISFETSFPLLPTHRHRRGEKGVLLFPCQGFTAEWAEGLR